MQNNVCISLVTMKVTNNLTETETIYGLNVCKMLSDYFPSGILLRCRREAEHRV